jgi:hypothetical protein
MRAARAVVRPTERLPDATDEQLPGVLVSPPWTKRRGKTKPVVLAGLTAPDTTELTWTPGEQRQWAALADRYRYHSGQGDWQSPELLAAVADGTLYPYWQPHVLLHAPMELALPVLRDWLPPERTRGIDGWGRPLLGRFGLDAVPAVLSSGVLRDPNATRVPVLGPILNAATASAMAGMFARLKSLRGTARAWFLRHGVAAVPMLVPAALGTPGAERTGAELALRLLADRFGRDHVLAATAMHGEAAVDAVRVALDLDPLEALPTRLPQIPDWAHPALLPQIRLLDKTHGLPLDAVGHLLTMLAVGKPGEPYGGVGLVVRVCDPESLAEFAWALFLRWRDAGLPAKEGWVLTALGVIGNDETVRRLAPLIRSWPGDGGHQRAVAGLDVLAEIGSDVALMHLNGIAQKVKFAGLKNKAKAKISQVALELDLSPQQLADRLVPDLGLDADGSLVLDYGPRRFTVGFTEQLKPYVSDVDGARLKALPKPGAKDDEELAPAAYQRFAALKKDARTIAADQINRLEQGMVTQRRWTGTEFATLFVAHPLLWHVARRLVWAVYDEGAVVTAFRVAEDRTFADVDDDMFTLPAEATVGIPHPLQLGAAVPAWSAVFADYEILQPFPQLGRQALTLTDAEREGTHLSRFEGAVVPVGKVLGMTRHGWERGDPQDGGVEPWISKPLPDGRVVVVHLDPGIAVGDPTALGDPTIEHIVLSETMGHYYYANDSSPKFGSLDAVSEAELVADLTELNAP